MRKIKLLAVLALCSLAMSAAAEDYALNFSKDTVTTSKQTAKGNLVSITVAGQKIPIEDGTHYPWKVYYDKTSEVVNVKAGQTINFAFDVAAEWTNGYVYIDFGKDGKFDWVDYCKTWSDTDHKQHPTLAEQPSDLISFSQLHTCDITGTQMATVDGKRPLQYAKTMPSYTLPSDLAPGDYRLRFKIDCNSGDPGGSADIVKIAGGNVVDITLRVAEAEKENYPLNFDKDTKTGSKETDHGNLVSITVAGQKIPVEDGTNYPWKVYYDKTSEVVNVKAGQTINFAFDVAKDWTNGYVYIDFGKDGQFSWVDYCKTWSDTDHKQHPTLAEQPSDLISFSQLHTCDITGAQMPTVDGKRALQYAQTMPSYTLPSDLAPGDYRLRFKIDCNSGDPGGSTDIVKGGTVVDITLRVGDEELEEVTIGENGWTAFSSEKNLDFSNLDGFTAYIVKEVTNDGVYLDPIKAAPAGTGLLLKANEGTYKAKIVDWAESLTNNKLVGCSAATTLNTGDGYVFGVINGKVGFYAVGNEGYTVEAGKAYLPKTSTSTFTAKYIPIDSTTTLVKTIFVSNEELDKASIYNLQGQRVSKDYRGIVIINGKKVVNK